MYKKTLVAALLSSTAALGFAESKNSEWFRQTAISPDGTQIAFSYKGDIYLVASKGGVATPLTTSPSYEGFPTWSPDGKRIAYSSDQYGNLDIFVVSSEGGATSKINLSFI